VKAGRPGETDRRDALRWRRSHRAGDLTAVWVPDAGLGSARDLGGRAKQPNRSSTGASSVEQVFMRTASVDGGVKAWTELYMAWVRQLRYDRGGRRRRVWITSQWSHMERG